MKKIKQPPLDKFTTDLLFQPSAPKLFILPQRYPRWEKIKQELEVLASGSVESAEKAVEQVFKIIRLSQKGKVKLKAMESFCHFLEAIETGKLDSVMKKSQEDKEEETGQISEKVTGQKVEDKQEVKKEEEEPGEVGEEEQTKEKKEEETPEAQEEVKQISKPTHKIFQPAEMSLSLFIQKTLPFIAKSALRVEELFPSGEVEMLIAAENKSITFSKQQALCFLSHMFFCTFDEEERHFPASFIALHQMSFKVTSYQPQKFFCISYYFERMRLGIHSAHDIVIERVVLSKNDYDTLGLKNWLNCEHELRDLHYYKGSIEQHSVENSIEVDFANELIGGGVLRMGMVQEEILFLVIPECLVSLPLCQRMHSNEAILLRGVERFVGYTGYANTFKVTEGRFEDREVPRVLTAINALKMGKTHNHLQFTPPALLRELNKAYIGFQLSEEMEMKEKRRTVVTGKWGCGAFGGNPQLKLLIQWLAASKQGRDVIFCGFGDKELDNTRALVKKITKEKLSIGKLFTHILQFCESKSATKIPIFSHLLKVL